MYGTGGEYMSGSVCSSSTGNCSDVWALTANGWFEISVVNPTVRPAETLHASVVHDSKRDRYVLWRPASASSVETWLFDPSSRTWATLSGTQVSSDRQKALLVYDPRRERTLLIGGSTWAEAPRVPEVWALRSDGADWSKEDPANRGSGVDPPPLVLPSVVYDSKRGRVVLFGGSLGGANLSRQTWVYGGP